MFPNNYPKYCVIGRKVTGVQIVSRDLVNCNRMLELRQKDRSSRWSLCIMISAHLFHFAWSSEEQMLEHY